MKKLIFYLIIICLLMGLLFVTFKWYHAYQEAADLRRDKTEQVRAIQSEAKEISRKVNENGIETVLFDITKNRASTAQVKSNEGIKGIIDTTALALDIRTKQLQQILILKGSLEAENLKLKKQLDANSRPFYTYSGQGLNLKFTPPSDQDSTSEGTADFNADVTIKATQYWKRNWFLGSKKSILSVSSTSKLFKINGADYVEFEQEEPVFGLRLQAAANYNPQTGSLGFGPAARIDLGRWSLQGNYTYYPESGRWRPSINANFDIVRF